MTNLKKIKKILAKYFNILIKSRILLFVILIVFLLFVIFYYNYNPKSQTSTSNYLLNTNGATYAQVISTFPENNSTTTAYSISLDFSQNILGQEFTVKTRPQMNVETNVLSTNPYKLFITPQDFWEYREYQITIQSPIMIEDYVLNLTFEEDRYEPVIEEVYTDF